MALWCCGIRDRTRSESSAAHSLESDSALVAEDANSRLSVTLARLSSRGVHRIIKGSSHEIQLDKPQAVIDAVDEVLRQLHTGAKS